MEQCRAVLIDDEEWIREGLTEHIHWEQLGIELVKSFGNGADAFQFIEQNEVHIILSDIRMPNMTGIELLASLREMEQKQARIISAEVIFLTGYDDFKFAQTALKLGALDYILKPAEVSDIEDALIKARDAWHKESSKYLNLNDGINSTSPVSVEPISYLISKALQALHSRYMEDLQVTQIAEELFITPNYLSRLFKQETGISFSEHLSQIRVQKACELLVETNEKIYRIGEVIGHGNPRYFSEWFVKQMGMTPGEYRNWKSS
jgi:YesN/AraC family two-component response regulator